MNNSFHFRSQFPKVPVTQPVLPAWQLASQTDSSSIVTSQTDAAQEAAASPGDTKQELSAEAQVAKSLSADEDANHIASPSESNTSLEVTL